MFTTKRPHVYILIDRSGSMKERWAEAMDSIDQYVRGLKEADPLVTPVFFSDWGGPQIDVRPTVLASEWESLQGTPNGGTPLYDAIARIAGMALDASRGRTAIVIMTDGNENASRSVTKQGAKEWLDRCRRRDWEVLFLGADFDAMPQAIELGARMDKILNTTRGNYQWAASGLATGTSSYFQTGNAVNIDADPELRSRSIGKAA